MRASSALCRRGMTLLELMLALSVAALLLVWAHAFWRVADDGASRVSRGAAAVGAAAASYWTVRLLTQRAHADSLAVADFRATDVEARFASRCDDAMGGDVPCEVVLRVDIDPATRAAALVAQVAGASVAQLPLGSSGRLRFLRSGAGGGEWTSRWEPSLHPPLAIEAVGDSAAIFLAIGVAR